MLIHRWERYYHGTLKEKEESKQRRHTHTLLQEHEIDLEFFLISLDTFGNRSDLSKKKY